MHKSNVKVSKVHGSAKEDRDLREDLSGQHYLPTGLAQIYLLTYNYYLLTW